MSRGLCVALICGLAAAAVASPRTDPTAGRAVFTGATTANPTSIDLDPAALGIGTEIDELYVAAMAVVDHLAIARQNVDLAGTVTPGDSVHDTSLAPGSALAYIWHLKDRATLAILLRAARSESFPANHLALQYHTLGGSRWGLGGTVGGSIRITNEVHFGISLALERKYLHLQYARDTALANGHGPGGVDSACGGSPCGLENPQATETYDVQVKSALFSRDAITVNLGFVVALAKDTWLGVAYHTPPGLSVQNELDGSMAVIRAPRDGGNVLHGDAVVYVSEPASVDTELRTRLAQQLDLHVGGRWVNLSRLSAYDVRGLDSVFPGSGIPEWTERPLGYHDSFALWGGVEQVDTGESLRLGGRLGVETSAVDDNRTSPMVIAPMSYTLDVGAQLRVTDTIILQATYGVQYFPTVHVTNSAFDPNARIRCIASGYDYSTPDCEAVRLGYAIPTADGDYGRFEHAFRIALRIERP